MGCRTSLLESYAYFIYIDWITDYSMDRSHVTDGTLHNSNIVCELLNVFICYFI